MNKDEMFSDEQVDNWLFIAPPFMAGLEDENSLRFSPKELSLVG